MRPSSFVIFDADGADECADDALEIAMLTDLIIARAAMGSRDVDVARAGAFNHFLRRMFGWLS